MRKNVWVPDELVATIREQMPDLNWSLVLRTGLEALLGCRHERAVCSQCAAPIDVPGERTAAVAQFYRESLWALEDLVCHGGTAEGACRVLQAQARRWALPTAGLPLPRPTRAERRAFDAARAANQRPASSPATITRRTA